MGWHGCAYTIGSDQIAILAKPYQPLFGCAPITLTLRHWTQLEEKQRELAANDQLAIARQG